MSARAHTHTHIHTHTTHTSKKNPLRHVQKAMLYTIMRESWVHVM